MKAQVKYNAQVISWTVAEMTRLGRSVWRGIPAAVRVGQSCVSASRSFCAEWQSRIALILLSAACGLLLTGCTVTRYTSPVGETFSRWSFGTKTSVGVLTVDAGTNGLRRVSMKGYANDQVESLGVVTEAAVSAAIKGAKP